MADTTPKPGDRSGIHWSAIVIILGVPLLLFAATNAVGRFLDPGEHYLGVFRGDLFYYLANARELFENGNGLFYSDPFSASFSGPRVFSHLELILFGWTWRLTGIPLPTIWQGAQILFGALMLLSLHHLLTCVVERRHLAFAFVVVALAGGAEWANSLVAMAGAEQPISYLQAFDIGRGTRWLPNVFQNVPFATQSFYHVIAFATFAAVLRDKRGLALVGLFLIWWSHPFTGLQVTAILSIHAAIESWTTRERRAHEYTLGVALLSGLFLGYYLVALPLLSPEAADITGRWRGFPIAELHLTDLSAMWGLFLLWPLFFLKKSLYPVDMAKRVDRFLCIWMAVVAILLVHDLFLPASIKHFQPGHFAHGYLFVPMAVLTLRGLAKLTKEWPARWKQLAAGLFLLAAVADNVSFAALEGLRPVRPYFTQTESELTEFLANLEPGLVLIHDLDPIPARRETYSLLNGSIMSVLTPHRYFLYSRYQTPWYERKYQEVNAMMGAGIPSAHAARLGIRWIVQDRAFRQLAREVPSGRARIVFENADYRVFEIMVSP